MQAPVTGLFFLRMTIIPAAYYQQELSAKEIQAAAMLRKFGKYSILRLVLGVVFLTLLYFAFRENTTVYWLATGVIVAAFLYAVRLHSATKDHHALLLLSIKLLNDELQALDGNYTSFLPGKEFINTAHPYSYDLDIFGDGSIFQMICRSVTQSGYKGLAILLQEPYADTGKIAERQSAVKELAAKPGLLQQFRVTGAAAGEEGVKDREHILSWMGMDDKFVIHSFLGIASVIVPLTAIIFIALSVMQQTIHPGLLLVLMVNWTVQGIYGKDIKQTHLLAGRSAKLIDKYERLLHVIAGEKFDSGLLKQCAEYAQKSVPEIMQFRKLVHLFDSRQNGMTGPLMNSFFLFDIYCVLKLEKWRSKNRRLLDEAFGYVDVFDVYTSLATYAFNHPGNNYAIVDDSKTALIARDIKHPLIASGMAIGNDINIGIKESFYLLTGANMTGKSTFIRTIGANLVLSYTGLPVPVDTLRVPLVKVYTAIRISDSVQDDVSYFKAELNRLQQIMAAISNTEQPYLILLDEPLRGTNSTDKQQGTRSIMEKLIAYHSIGIVATHDTGLCDMEHLHKGKISNYHFESKVEKDHLSFDYKLKPGCSTSNNATILMKLMDII